MSYKSSYTGEQLDQAIGYFLGMQSGYRDTLAVQVATTDWKSTTDTAYSVYGKYHLKISVTGVSSLGVAPIVYLIDGNGVRWEVGCVYYARVTNGSQNSWSDVVECISNEQIAGQICMATTLTKDGTPEIGVNQSNSQS